MPKYLWQVTYTPEGAQGLLSEGGSVRSSAITEMVESVGGSVESVHFALGGHDLYVIGEVPDDLAVATLEFRTRASGIARSVPIRLLTPQEMDDAVHRNAAYRTPGH